MEDLPLEDAQALIRAIVNLAQMADRVLPAEVSPLSQRLQAHLGALGEVIPNTSATFPSLERANIQLALDAFAFTADPWEVIGLTADIGNYGGVSLPGLVSGSWHGPGEAARQYVSADVAFDKTIACLRAGVILTMFEGEPVVAMVHSTERFPPGIEIEVVAVRQDLAESFLQRLRELMDEHNSFRGKVISFSFGIHGEFGITFSKVPSVPREHVILRDGDLAAIEEHAIGISDQAAELVAAGQHVKRGLLLYGPPGTGKTHTISYLLGRMSARTTIVLNGAAVGAVGQAGTIARHLQPATIIIEDVDLIAMDRTLPGGEHNPLLFQLLNEMDGLADDADVLFILTTNRVDLLEPALAARPGRIDQAIEISLPDAPARRRLVELYARASLDGTDGTDGERLIERTDRVAPAFIKELARRATLIGLRTGTSAVSRLHEALDAMLHQSAPILRRTLAGPADDPSVPAQELS